MHVSFARLERKFNIVQENEIHSIPKSWNFAGTGT